MAKTKIAPNPLLERSPSHLLHRALQLAVDIYTEETGAGAITQRQFAVLTAAAAQPGCTQSDLVRATGIDRSTLAELAARLIAKGLLSRERSATDARANTVALTDEGRAALDDLAPKAAAADKRILGLMSGGKRDRFVDTLQVMIKTAAKGEKGEKTPKADKPSKAEKAAKKKAKGERKAEKKRLAEAVTA